jgi:integrase
LLKSYDFSKEGNTVYLIVEKISNEGIYFEKIYNSHDGTIISNETIHFRNAKVKYNRFEYVYLYDMDMNPIPKIFDYLNFEIGDSSPNNRYVASTALKLLYSFLLLFKLELQSLSKNDVKNLIAFLQGISKKGTLYEFDLLTLRSYSTINTYLAIYRNFVSYLGYEESVFLKKSNKHKYIINSETDVPNKITQYEISTPDYKPELSTPRYISVNDFKKILDVIRKDYTLREECIVRLMFENGLRLGEVLGLTNEDMIENERGAYLYLRNRCSDSFDQLAKGCMKVNTKRQYKTNAYDTKDFGYQIVFLNETLLKKITDYVNEFHENEGEKFQSNYMQYTIADSVSIPQDDSKNFYLFINTVGKPLSANLWGKTLREIFKKAGLNIDKERREINLSHRFRHGFAMFMVRYKKIEVLELKMLLRHRSINSVQHYYRPTDEDIVKMRTGFVNSIYEVIPELSI